MPKSGCREISAPLVNECRGAVWVLYDPISEMLLSVGDNGLSSARAASSGSWYHVVSTHWSNLRPTSRSVPTSWTPTLPCRAWLAGGGTALRGQGTQLVVGEWEEQFAADAAAGRQARVLPLLQQAFAGGLRVPKTP